MMNIFLYNYRNNLQCTAKLFICLIDINMASSHLELSVHYVNNNNSDAPIKVW